MPNEPGVSWPEQESDERPQPRKASSLPVWGALAAVLVAVVELVLARQFTGYSGTRIAGLCVAAAAGVFILIAPAALFELDARRWVYARRPSGGPSRGYLRLNRFLGVVLLAGVIAGTIAG